MKSGVESLFCIGAYSKKLYGIFSLKRKGVLRENESRSFNGICFLLKYYFVMSDRRISGLSVSYSICSDQRRMFSGRSPNTAVSMKMKSVLCRAYVMTASMPQNGSFPGRGRKCIDTPPSVPGEALWQDMRMPFSAWK